MNQERVAEAVSAGATVLGIELGSTRIKACLVAADAPDQVIATGGNDWENSLVDGLWTYPLDAVWHGVQSAFADLSRQVSTDHGVDLVTVGAVGVSAMMHGYLAFDERGELLVPFRTWRNTNTGAAAAELSETLQMNIPLRWSIAHLYQAVLDDEPHLDRLHHVTTLAGYVHERLSGERVLGVGDASGMFPIASEGIDYEPRFVGAVEAAMQRHGRTLTLTEILPRPIAAGDDAGRLTAEGASLLDASGRLEPGGVMAPPEGDAGTGMVATNAITPRTGNVSVGTSIFAMVVMPSGTVIDGIHEEIDLVTTPSGLGVAMVHCNNGASELAAWVGLFRSFAADVGADLTADDVFGALLRRALDGDADAGGLLAYNHLAGEPVAGLTDGRPLFVRSPESRFTLPNTVRAHVYGMFATLALGMEVLREQNVTVAEMFAHGGVFRTAGVAQQLLAAALNVPVTVAASASEGGSWGMAVLAAYRRHVASSHGAPITLEEYLERHVFADAALDTVTPVQADVDGFATYLERYRRGLAVEAAAVDAV